ncbi:MAG: Hvo_1808 family surface protein [Halodesulfurarchaeum sp.]
MGRRLGVLALVGLLALAGCVSAPAPSTPALPPSGMDPSPTENPPPPPATDRLGWESGYWHNETLAVTTADGLNRSELDAVIARAKARVEAIRGLEFQKPVPVEIISRKTFRERTGSDGSSIPTVQRLHQEVKFEALFFLGESESAIRQQSQNTASSVMGYYNPRTHSITLISNTRTPMHLNEITLAQELFHALQEQTFEISELSAHTRETRNAKLGIIEGDANYVDYLYKQRYGGALIMPDGGGGSGGGGGGVHVGMLALRLQPYSDGPVFVERIRRQSGWAGVNEVYERPPQSTEQTIHPAKYRVDEPVTVTIEDRSGPKWRVPDLGEGHVDYAKFGEAGLYVMLWYPSHVATVRSGQVTDVIIPYRHFFRTSDPVDTYNYSHPFSDGWEGDKLLPYITNDSAATGETGYVWKIVWETTGDAREFRSAYEDLLAFHGARQVAGNTYRIAEGPFADAFRVRRSGRTVIIVNAPTVEQLAAVHERP